MGTANWDEGGLKSRPTNHWRASLVPAAAVIPAPGAYTKVAVVKKLVVGLVGGFGLGFMCGRKAMRGCPPAPHAGAQEPQGFYVPPLL